jgi:LmbE family N-acetylglucosaminyl deacetylase
MKILLFGLGLLLGIPGLFAQVPPSLNSAEIFLGLKKLNVLGSVLYIAAHPDDENTRLLTFLAKGGLYRTGYLSMTRGDGGQNLIGDEQGVELGLIRTQELLAARRIDGAEQFFTRAFDFGFTKTTEEALQTWDKEKVLSDVVWVIRRFQPDVIVTRFPGDSRAGHGHHSASAVLAREAFDAAASADRFPEQFKYGVKPWQAKRLLWNTFNFGGANTTSEDQLKIDVGVYNAVLGKSYGEIAAESRSQHKSQGFGVPRSRGQAIEYFTTISGDAPKADLMEGVLASWDRVEGAGKIQALADQIIQQYSLTHPENSVRGLVDLYKEISGLKEGYWKFQKLKEVQQLIEACSGLWLEASVGNPYTVQGDSLQIVIGMINRLGANITLNEIKVNGFDTLLKQDLNSNKNYFITKSVIVEKNKEVTQPYWLAEEMSPGSFNVKDQLMIGEAQGKPAVEVQFGLRIQGTDFIFTRPVRFKFTDPVKGELYEPLTVLPPVTGRFDPDLLIFTSGSEKNFDIITKTQGTGNIQPAISLSSTTDNVSTRKLGNFFHTTYTYAAHPLKKESGVFFSNLIFDRNGRAEPAKELKTISYDHIPRIDYFFNSKLKFVVADLRIEGKRIGYIEGAGDKVPQALQQMGYEVVLLKEKEITPANLKPLDAVLTGIRAYNIHDWLSDKYEILMDYVKNGGNLIVQYNTNSQVGPVKAKISPYPFNISRNRVTDENAKVSFLQPDHPVLNFPNKITEKDFEGWIQERGIYFADQPDAKFETVLSMHDPGESDQKGSLIISSFGKGKFVYTGLVFFRELPAGVPGAYRLIANIIALNHTKGF